jgi:hypothetical protein
MRSHRWPSSLRAFLTSASSFSWLSPSLPSSTTLMAQLFFLRSFPTLTSACCVSCTGEPTNSTMRASPFWLGRFLSASRAILMPFSRRHLPVMGVLSREMARCRRGLSAHCVAWIVHRGPASVMMPTVFSGLAVRWRVQMMLAASRWALMRVGGKSPFRIHSELSRQSMRCSMVACSGAGGQRSLLCVRAESSSPGAAIRRDDNIRQGDKRSARDRTQDPKEQKNPSPSEAVSSRHGRRPRWSWRTAPPCLFSNIGWADDQLTCFIGKTINAQRLK